MTVDNTINTGGGGGGAGVIEIEEYKTIDNGHSTTKTRYCYYLSFRVTINDNYNRNCTRH